MPFSRRGAGDFLRPIPRRELSGLKSLFWISLCNLCVLCVSVVDEFQVKPHHRDPEDKEVAQRRARSRLLFKASQGVRTMRENKVSAIAIKCFVLVVVLSMAHQATAQNARTPYPKMAPIDQYLMADRDAEIALARTAAPDSIDRKS